MLQAIFKAVGNRVLQIHSSKRKDRAQMTALWSAQHNVIVPHFEAIMRENGAEGCTLSHTSVAKHFGHTHPFLVLEDDALPTLALQDTQLVHSVLTAIDSQEFDILYLGGLPAASRVLKTQFHGILEGKCGATYAMIVFPRAAEFLAHHTWRGFPIDVELVRNKGLRSGFVHPPLFVMAATRSDIGKNEFNRSELFSKLLFVVAPVWRGLVVWQKELLGIVCVALLLSLLKWKLQK